MKPPGKKDLVGKHIDAAIEALTKAGYASTICYDKLPTRRPAGKVVCLKVDEKNIVTHIL